MLKILCLKDMARQAKEDGLKMMMGGDINVYPELSMKITTWRIVNLLWIISVLMIVH